MIFVTVGTHEQPFDRLVQKIDELVQNGNIKDEVIMQTGYCTYIPQACRAQKYFSYLEMEEYVKKADIVITHGGPSSFILPIQFGKVPIVVPRQKKFQEHVNDHQVEFVREVEKRYHSLIPIYYINDLKDVIEHYHEKREKEIGKYSTNNKMFCEKLQQQIDELFDNKEKKK